MTRRVAAEERGRSRIVSGAVTGFAIVAVVVTAVVTGAIALFVAATVSAVPALFLTCGFLASLAVLYGGIALVARWRWPPGRRRAARRIVFGAVGGALAVMFALTVIVPGGEPETSPSSPTVPGAELLRLPSGTTLEVLRLPARGAGGDKARTGAGRPPVIVLHGGPGVPDLAANARVFAPLAERGRDVYLYAQLGTGRSTRLTDVHDYSRDRDAADLEALRRRLGLDRVVLVGHSYGGALAAHYLALHPDRVDRLVLLSPGALDPEDRSGDLVSDRLDTGTRLRLYARLLTPRALIGYGLLQVDPEAAHAFLPDAEADARNDEVVNLIRPALHCPGARLGPAVRGTGFYAMQYPQSATASPPSDPRPRLAGLRAPALIVKGSCDYLSWRSAVEYRRLLPDSRLLYYEGAGHNVHQDRPSDVVAAVSAFLDGRWPGGPVHEGVSPPAGYRGPP